VTVCVHRIPADGSSVPKYVGESTNHEMYLMICILLYYFKFFYWLKYLIYRSWDPRWRSGYGTTLKTNSSRVRFPMVPLEFFNDIILPVALWGRLSI
jgi:hypothetical protein